MILLSLHCHHCASRWVEATSGRVPRQFDAPCIYCGSKKVRVHDHDDVAEQARAEAA